MGKSRISKEGHVIGTLLCGSRRNSNYVSVRTCGGEKTLSISYLVDVAKDSVPVLTSSFFNRPAFNFVLDWQLILVFEVCFGLAAVYDSLKNIYM